MFRTMHNTSSCSKNEQFCLELNEIVSKHETFVLFCFPEKTKHYFFVSVLVQPEK